MERSIAMEPLFKIGRTVAAMFLMWFVETKQGFIMRYRGAGGEKGKLGSYETSIVVRLSWRIHFITMANAFVVGIGNPESLAQPNASRVSIMSGSSGVLVACQGRRTWKRSKRRKRVGCWWEH